MGRNSKCFGDAFEEIFYKICQRSDIAITRVPDGCRQLGSNKLIRIKSPFDWILSHEGKTAFIDTKTIQGAHFSNSQIKPHQIEAMCIHEDRGAKAGYVIWARSTSKIFFIPSSALAFQMAQVGSFNESHPQALLLGNEIFDPRLIFSEHQIKNSLVN